MHYCAVSYLSSGTVLLPASAGAMLRPEPTGRDELIHVEEVMAERIRLEDVTGDSTLVARWFLLGRLRRRKADAAECSVNLWHFGRYGVQQPADFQSWKYTLTCGILDCVTGFTTDQLVYD